MKKKLLLSLVLLTSISFAGCATQDKTQIKKQKESEEKQESILKVNDEGETKISGDALTQHLSQSALVDLSEEEVNGLKFMLEEEKLARDVYIKLYEKWEQQSFKNISQSEATHISAIQRLIEKYKVDASFFDDEVGKFTDKKLLTLYTDLVKQGESSLIDALKVGALIEEIDIVDLEGYLQKTSNSDLSLVYENLLRGSRNHLRSFVRTMAKQGEEYEPQKIEVAKYEMIINSKNERGDQRRGGEGKGSGQRNNSNR